MYIIVVGGGKVGYNLAKLLLAERHEVLLIEKDKAKTASLAAEFGESLMEGNGSRVSVLREGGANRADVLVAVTGTDEDNLVICQVAKTVFKCPRTIARVNDPRNESFFSTLGVDATVSSTRLIDSLIEEQVKAEDMVIPLVTLRSGNVEIIEIDPSPSSWIMGKKIREIHLPEGAIFISVIRGEKIIIPKGDTELTPGDKVVALVKKEVEQALREML
ncbi:MAG TPA: NAD-binding protein [Candidatus Manganitrophaceae bacterium]|nr:NAD-binding protein [Candidatus Manganitrophaceae bacterium]